jgi:hypothetical protein
MTARRSKLRVGIEVTNSVDVRVGVTVDGDTSEGVEAAAAAVDDEWEGEDEGEEEEEGEETRSGVAAGGGNAARS